MLETLKDFRRGRCSLMRRKRYYILPQRYPAHDGSRPLSFALYRGAEFLCYSWSLSRAWVALQLIKQTVKGKAQWQKKQ